MFIIGKANAEEIEQMKELGFDVEDVDVRHFDLALMGDGQVTDYEPDRYEPDKLVAIFLDCDIAQECRSIIAEEKSLTD